MQHITQVLARAEAVAPQAAQQVTVVSQAKQAAQVTTASITVQAAAERTAHRQAVQAQLDEIKRLPGRLLVQAFDSNHSQ